MGVKPETSTAGRQPSSLKPLFDLCAARSSDNPGVIALLVGFGVEVNARDEYGTTPLDFAVAANHPLLKGKVAVIAALRDAGAD